MPRFLRNDRFQAVVVAMAAAGVLIVLAMWPNAAAHDGSRDVSDVAATDVRGSNAVAAPVVGAADVATTDESASHPPERLSVPILVYHNIRNDKAGQPPSSRIYEVTPAEFDAQMALVAEQGFTPVSFAQLDAALEGRAQLPTKPMIITLDDGTLPHYTTAFPILQKHGLTATFFVFTHAMDANPNYMTWAQLAEMRDAGMDIQSHTVLHPYLAKADDALLAAELGDSRAELIDQLGVDGVVVAYPFGQRDARVDAAAAAAGYRLGRGLRQTNSFAPADRYDLPARIITGDLKSFATFLRNAATP